jgi:hypothetical protein
LASNIVRKFRIFHLRLARSGRRLHSARHLAQPARSRDDTPAQDGRFEVHIEKGRGLHGEDGKKDAKPFEARLDVREGKTACSMKDVEAAARLQGRARFGGPDDTMQIGGTCSWSR